MRLNLPHVALRGRAVVVLVERQGGYYADVVYDACAIMWASAACSTRQSRLSVHAAMMLQGGNL